MLAACFRIFPRRYGVVIPTESSPAGARSFFSLSISTAILCRLFAGLVAVMPWEVGSLPGGAKLASSPVRNVSMAFRIPSRCVIIAFHGYASARGRRE